MFQTGVFFTKHDWMWIKVALHVGGTVRGYVLTDIEKEIKRIVKKDVLKSSRDKAKETEDSRRKRL